jgi:phosphoribosylformylglycinamidine cyclo-ligase
MTSVDYKSAGVDIAAGNEAVKRIIKSIVQDYQHPVLVQSIDGVGTKTIIAHMMNKYDTLGMDLVSSTTNDIIVLGAKPLTLLDYIANDKLNPAVVESLVSGMVKACRENNISLVGGETAEMPGTYLPGEIELVGVITGVVEKDGLHTNGYSLARKLCFDIAKYPIDKYIPELQRTIGEALLEPHINYTRPVLHLLKHDIAIKGMAHITGGGILENIPRVLPAGCAVEIHKNSWPEQALFSLLVGLGHLTEEESYRTFNMGVGLVMIVDASMVDKARAALKDYPDFTLFEIGKVVEGERNISLCV